VGVQGEDWSLSFWGRQVVFELLLPVSIRTHFSVEEMLSPLTDSLIHPTFSLHGSNSKVHKGRNCD
jgi:hypothetical protein